MNMLANLTTSDDIAPETDRVGGRQLLDAGVYAGTIKMAYLQKSSGGALGLTIVFDLEGGKELRTTQYLTGGDKKGNLNYYVDKNNNKQYLPGFNLGNSLAMLTTGKELSKLSTEERLVNIYDTTAKAEKPTAVQVVVDLLGEEINVGVLRVMEDKMNKDESTGQYTVYTGETREVNEVDKFFCSKTKFLNMTTAEIRGKAEKAVYIDTWTKDNAGQVRDKRNKELAKQGGAAGAPKPGATGAAAGGTSKPDESLFD